MSNVMTFVEPSLQLKLNKGLLYSAFFPPLIWHVIMEKRRMMGQDKATTFILKEEDTLVTEQQKAQIMSEIKFKIYCMKNVSNFI